MTRRRTAIAFFHVIFLLAVVPAMSQEVAGVLPTDAQGRPLNFDFETGDLSDWKAEGEAFAGQPVEGDTVAARRSDMKSGHAGRYWVGTFEREGDGPQGMLISAPFLVTKPCASFLIAGGSSGTTRMELVRADSGKVVFQTSGDDTEELKRVAVDLTAHLNKELFVRLVDQHGGGWGHLNFDDFRLHDRQLTSGLREPPLRPDEYAHGGDLSAEQAAKVMTVPEGFRVIAAAGEPAIVRPIAMTIDNRGRLWVAENHAYPFKAKPEEARDRILIFEDTDGDGTLDSRKLFLEGLNMVTGLEYGFGGVWVGAAPELLFIPDADQDDRPDGPPQVLLDGWGLQDTHETLNSFIWGPDGWLYGCHGVFTKSEVGKPGTPRNERVQLNAGVWRYHPQRHQFEVFAHGTSNPWGVDFDARGQCLIEACVIPHLYHMVQGGRYERQAGQHFNPYTYDDIKTIADHRHYLGATPHGGNDRSDSAGGGHAHAGLMIYQGDAWPQQYQGSLFMNNIHGARLNRDVLTPQGSGFVGGHAPDFLLANDRASQVLYLRSGPDGNVWMIDWYDMNQCHRPDATVHQKTKGRIFKVVYGDRKSQPVDLASWPSEKLIDLLETPDVRTGTVQVGHPDSWHLRQARLLLQERGLDQEGRERLARIALGGKVAPGTSPNLGGEAAATPTKVKEPTRLMALWMLHGAGGLDAVQVKQGLASDSPYIRAWTIQLACEKQPPGSDVLTDFAKLARDDESPVVRLYLASALQRLPLEARWSILEGLVAHAEDADDPNLPLMYWYAAEPLAEVDAARALRLAIGSPLRRLGSFMARRVGALGTDQSIALLIDGLDSAKAPGTKLNVLEAINEALKGRRQVAMPPNWPQVFERLVAEPDDALRGQAIALGSTFGDPQALGALKGILFDPTGNMSRRSEALTALLKTRDNQLPGVLRALIGQRGELRGQALRGLAAFDDPETPAAIVSVYDELAPAEKRDALATLATRKESARVLLDAVGAQSIPARDLTADVVRQLRSHGDAAIEQKIGEVWGSARETSKDRALAISELKSQLARDVARPVDLALGRALYARVCQQCHTLFGQGAQVGPEITGANRSDLDYVLSNVMDPSALIGKDYQAHVIATTDGRVLTGLIRAEDRDAITLVTANETLTVPKAEVEERQLSDQSMMPDDLLKPLSWDETRALLAYLASPSQTPLKLTSENAAQFFSGKDLAGWTGDPALWSVQNGEIVGKTTGLDHNAFLVSDYLAGDFKLILEVKLVDNAGNSGVQFRSQALPDGEMKGDQADIGVGWWGKLYEENGRGLLWDKSGEAHVKTGEWNAYEITARGSKIETRINGQLCVDLNDPAGTRQGVFALQLHSGGATEVRFRNFELQPLEP